MDVDPILMLIGREALEARGHNINLVAAFGKSSRQALANGAASPAQRRVFIRKT